MEIIKVVFLFWLLVTCFVDASISKDVYKVEINERGTFFNETVEIDEKDRSVVYQVPHHNDVVQSEIRYDYRTGFFATRIPKLKECYIQRIPKDQSSLTSVKRNLEQYQMFVSRKSTLPVKVMATAVVKERRLYGKDLSPSFLTFCGDFKAYLARQIYHQGVSQAKGSETNGEKQIEKRAGYPIPVVILNSIDIQVGDGDGWKIITANTCKKLHEYHRTLEKGGCIRNPDDWEYHCGAKTKTCMYTVKCKFDPSVRKIRCNEEHFFTGWTCCKVKCPGQ